jgi:hypothetical protein
MGCSFINPKQKTSIILTQYLFSLQMARLDSYTLKTVLRHNQYFYSDFTSIHHMHSYHWSHKNLDLSDVVLVFQNRETGTSSTLIGMTIYYLRGKMNHGSSVIATGYGLDDRGVGVRVPVGSRIFASLYCPDWLWGPSIGHKGLFPRG